MAQTGCYSAGGGRGRSKECCTGGDRRGMEETMEAARTVARNAAYEAAYEAAKEAAKAAAEGMLISRDWELVGRAAARASLRYVIAIEETIHKIVSLSPSIMRMKRMNEEECINQLLNVDFQSLTKMNVGGKCWFFAQVWNLIKLAGLLTESFKKFTDRLSMCGETVHRFGEWMMGATYSPTDLIATCEEIVHLPKPLWLIVYSYLSPPSAEEIREEILSLI